MDLVKVLEIQLFNYAFSKIKIYKIFSLCHLNFEKKNINNKSLIIHLNNTFL